MPQLWTFATNFAQGVPVLIFYYNLLKYNTYLSLFLFQDEFYLLDIYYLLVIFLII